MGEAFVVVAGVALVLALSVWWVLQPTQEERQETWPIAAKHVLPEAQQEVLRHLSSAMPDMHVFPGVALSRLLYVQLASSAKESRERSAVFRRRFERHAVDFVVCDHSGRVAAVVDLNRPEELRAASRRQQEEKNKALASAEIRVVFWPDLSGRQDSEIRNLVLGGTTDVQRATDCDARRGLDDHRDDLPVQGVA